MTTAIQRYRRPRGQYPKRRDSEPRPKPLPEYLEAHEVNALMRAAPNSRAALLFLVQWRAGLRVSEALALEARDLSLDSDMPTMHVRRGKGAKPRIVPVHPELHSALSSSLQFGNIAQGDRQVLLSWPANVIVAYQGPPRTGGYGRLRRRQRRPARYRRGDAYRVIR